MFKALYNKIYSYLLCVKTNINNNKYNCKINFQINKCRNVKLFILKLLIKYCIELTTMSKINQSINK